jgi:leader peptidase (prepilin peptidase)/N-methyltransferase
LELVPLFSYLMQGGRCRHCGGRLRPSYLLIELAAIAVALSAAVFLSGWLLFASLYLGWSLLALAVIDARHGILPDPINLPLIPVGLLTAHLFMPDRLQAHLIGTLAGFAILATIAWLYRMLRNRDGIGLGDAKLYAAAGAWLGVEALPGIMLISALSALAVALARTVFGARLNAASEIAFGPYLAMAFWTCWLLGPLVLI